MNDNDIDDEHDDLIGERILRNEALVQLILESAENLREPMTVEEFMEQLRCSLDKSSPTN